MMEEEHCWRDYFKNIPGDGWEYMNQVSYLGIEFGIAR